MMVRVLDLTPGKRGIWFNKDHPAATFAPTDEVGFGLIVFDPPHVNTGATSNMSRDYGHHTSKEIVDFVMSGAIEAHKRSTQGALMAFKWNDHDFTLAHVLRLMATWWEPLFGQRTSTRSARGNSTYWVMLSRRDVPSEYGGIQ